MQYLWVAQSSHSASLCFCCTAESMSGSNKSKQKIDNIKVMKKIRKSESRRVKRIEFRHSDKVSVIFIQEWRYGQRLFCLFIAMMHRIIGLQSCLFCVFCDVAL